MASKQESEVQLPEDHATRAAAFRAFLESAPWLYLNQQLRAAYMTAWEKTMPDRFEEREEMYRLCKTLSTIEELAKKELGRAEYNMKALQVAEEQTKYAETL